MSPSSSSTGIGTACFPIHRRCSWRTVAAAPVGPNSTGLIQERNFAATLALVEKLHPDVTNVFVVTGAAPADKEYEDAMRAQTRPFESRLTFHYLSGLPTDELERRLARLPEHSVVYYLLVTEDGAGNKYHPLEYIDRVAAAANAPTYCWVDSAMDHGIVGGNLYSQTEAIGRIGQSRPPRAPWRKGRQHRHRCRRSELEPGRLAPASAVGHR